MAVQLVRVGPSWTKISSPGDQEYYYMNNSGNAVKFFFSDTEVNINADTAIPKVLFTMGGCIGQVKSPANKYMYAKAIPFISPIGTIIETTTDDIVIMREIEPINEKDTYAAIMKVLTEVMRLSTRVTANEYRHAKGHVDHLRNVKEIKQVAYNSMRSAYRLYKLVIDLFNRMFDVDEQLIDHKTRIHDTEELLHTYIEITDSTLMDLSLEIKDVAYQEHMNTATTDRILMNLLQRLLAAERFLSDARYNMNNLTMDVSNLKNLQIDQEEFSLFVTELKDIILNVNSINQTLLNMSNTQSTTTADVQRLQGYIAELNNAMNTIALDYTVDQINTAFEAVLDTTSSTMKPTVEALRDVTKEIAEARVRDAEHMAILDTKMDKDGLIILSPETTNIGNFAKNT